MSPHPIKKKAAPLRIIHGEEARMLRTRENTLLLRDSAGNVVHFPLVKKFGDSFGYMNRYVLQGVFEVQREGHEPEIITFYKEESLGGDLVAFAGQREIGRYSENLAYRKTEPEYRKLGIANHAFDLLEDSLSAEHAKQQKSAAHSHTAQIIKKTVELKTDMPLASHFLKNRGYAPYWGGFNYLRKELGHAPEAARLKENHRVKIIGIDGKVKYWTGKIKRP